MTNRDPSTMTDEELAEEIDNLPWPLDGIVTFDDEPTIHRSNELINEVDNRRRRTLPCPYCFGSRIEDVYTGHGNVEQIDCSMCSGNRIAK